MSRYYSKIRRVKCPAEENVNCEKSLHINARKNCGKTDIRANRFLKLIINYFAANIKGYEPVVLNLQFTNYNSQTIIRGRQVL